MENTLKKQAEIIEELMTEVRKLKSDLEETTRECQKHVDAIEKQNDELRAEIELLKRNQIVPEEQTTLIEKKVKDSKYKRTPLKIILAQD